MIIYENMNQMQKKETACPENHNIKAMYYLVWQDTHTHTHIQSRIWTWHL